MLDLRGYLLLAGAAYLIGSIPFALILTAIFRRTDLRSLGTGNLSIYNTAFNVGKVPAFLAFLCIGAAAYTAVALARAFFPNNDIALMVVLCAATIGSMWQLFARLRGSRGSSMAGWVLMFASPLLWAVMLGLWLAFALLVRRTRLATTLLHISCPAIFGLIERSWVYAAAGLILGIALQIKLRMSTDDTLALGLFRRYGVNVDR